MALLGAVLLAGCPLPQTLPEYPAGGPIAPPRIQSDAATPPDTVLEVAPDCAASPVFVLASSLVDENTLEKVEARWFVDYLPGNQAREAPRVPPELIEGPQDGVNTVRTVTPWSFQPYAFDPAGGEQAFRDGGGLHVVELVVSNGFAPEPASGQPSLPRPWRTPLDQFETQVFRWVFHYVPGGACGYPAP
jgi:hypothetical protein